MQVPAVKRARDLICGSIGTLPVEMFTPERAPARADLQRLLDQPEPDVAASVTWTWLLDDLFFEGRAWWRILQTGAHGFPVSVRRLDPRSVDIEPDGKVYHTRAGHQGTAREWLPDDQLVRFDSPNDGLLIAGARAIRTALALDAAAGRYADDPVPLGWFEPTEGVDPFEDEEGETDNAKVTGFLDQWSDARQRRAWGYVPPGVTLKAGTMSPRDLQLNDARQHAVLEIARAAGVDPEDLGVSTTSRTYFNAESKRKDKLDFTLLGYIVAVDDRLTMPDVTPRGYYVRHNLDAFLRTDTKTRYEAYEIGQRVGVLTKPEARALEDKPPIEDEETTMPNSSDSTVPDNVRELGRSVAASVAPGFAAPAAAVEIRLDAPQAPERFAVDVERRTITGLAVPYGKTARFMGRLYQFSAGSIRYGDPSRVKLLLSHEPDRAVGYAQSLTETDAGLLATFKVARGERGDEALIMADDKVWDGLSAGFAHGAQFTERDGVLHATHAPLFEISLTPCPAYEDARVHSVAATADIEGNITMGDTTVKSAAATEQTTTAPTGPTVAEQVAAELAKFGMKAGEGPSFSAEAVTKAIEDGFAALQRPQISTGQGGPGLPQRETVSAGGDGAAQFTVREEAPYRFDGSTRGEHCFTDDLRDMQNGNSEAKARLLAFMEEAHEQFAVTTGNTAAFNPTQNRPELYVPQLRYTRPLWESVSTGVINDKTPFTVPKFGAAAGLAADHVEGVEPTPGSFSATVQTVSPSAISGKVEINREVWDQGGNPQTDTIVWNEMQNAYFEAVEAKIATMLNAIAAANLYSGAEVNLAGAVDGPLQTAMLNLLVDLQFVRGGNRYTAAAAHGTLFKALVAAKDSTGRPLFPILNPTNADGSVSPLAAGVNVAGQTYRPAWALNTGAVNARHSYQFVPTSVWQWASAPKRFTFEYQVKSIDMAVWGYTGGAVLRESDVIRIDYEASDV